MKPRIATLDGIFMQNPDSGFYEPFIPDPEIRHPGLIIIFLSLAAWAIFIGASYALYRAFEAVTS